MRYFNKQHPACYQAITRLRLGGVRASWVFSGYAETALPSTRMSPLPILDPEAIANLRALNPDDPNEFLREIAGIFFEDTPKRIAELDQSLAAGDVKKFERAAHSIKGSSGNLGAFALREVAAQLELRSHKDGLGGVAGLVAELKVQFGLAEAELKKLLA
jgi:HPt (histidine-containing phosphotransfer) domain-containing protein